MERQIETVRESVMGQYEWIVLGKESRKERKKTIGKIRSHAMRETAASRKRSGTWGKHNQRQYPVEPVPSFSATECIPSDLPPAVPARRSGDKGNEPYFKLRLGLPMPLSGLDQLATEIGVNVLDLSALTTIHIGQTAMSFLMNDPNHLVGLVSVRKSSYLTHVATRYGSSYCLDDAVRCVATKAHRLLVGIGNGGRTLELTSYGKALRSLQTAIDLEQEWRNPEVLCAVQVLSLFEALELSAPSAWSQHIAGASRLIRARGPSSFQSDFEKLLLYSIAGAIISESAISNVACFLEAKPWQRALQSLTVTKQPFSRRGYIGVGLLRIKARMPRLLQDVTHVVREPTNIGSADLCAIIARLQKFRADIVDLSTELDGLTLEASKGECIVPSDADERVELLGDALTLLIMGCRLQSAVSMDEVVALEDKALHYSDQLVILETETTSANSLAVFYLQQKLIIAQATLNTSHIWWKSSSHINIVERSAFKAWCDGITVRCNF